MRARLKSLRPNGRARSSQDFHDPGVYPNPARHDSCDPTTDARADLRQLKGDTCQELGQQAVGAGCTDLPMCVRAWTARDPRMRDDFRGGRASKQRKAVRQDVRWTRKGCLMEITN